MPDLRPHHVRVRVWRDGARWHYEWITLVDILHNPAVKPRTGTAWTRWGVERKAGREVGSWLIALAHFQYGRDEFQMMLDVPDPQ
jgi:hypothetical protein